MNTQMIRSPTHLPPVRGRLEKLSSGIIPAAELHDARHPAPYRPAFHPAFSLRLERRATAEQAHFTKRPAESASGASRTAGAARTAAGPGGTSASRAARRPTACPARPRSGRRNEIAPNTRQMKRPRLTRPFLHQPADRQAHAISFSDCRRRWNNHSENAISRTSGRRRSTVRRRSDQPLGGPFSRARRSRPFLFSPVSRISNLAANCPFPCSGKRFQCTAGSGPAR